MENVYYKHNYVIWKICIISIILLYGLMFRFQATAKNYCFSITYGLLWVSPRFIFDGKQGSFPFVKKPGERI